MSLTDRMSLDQIAGKSRIQTPSGMIWTAKVAFNEPVELYPLSVRNIWGSLDIQTSKTGDS
jgi:hypothetical protein